MTISSSAPPAHRPERAWPTPLEGLARRGLRHLLSGMASRLKPGDYEVDADLPTWGYVSVGSRRGLALARAVVRGVTVSASPGHWVFLGRSVELRNRRQIRLGGGVTVGRGCVIDGLSRSGVELGKGVSIGPYAIIEATGVITNLGEGCSIGERSSLGCFSFIGAAGGVWIGSDVIMGNRVSFHSENHCFDDVRRPIREQGVTRLGIVIEDDCWIGANVTFLDGSRVGRGSVVGAGSVVRGEIPPGSVAAGVPARVIRSRAPSMTETGRPQNA